MSQEGRLLDKKYLRPVTSKTTGWDEIAKDCISLPMQLVTSQLTGTKDGQDAPADDYIPVHLPETPQR